MNGAFKPGQIWHPSYSSNPQSHNAEKPEKLAYADFLCNFEWDLYVTQTYRYVVREPIYACAKMYSTLEKFGATRAFIAAEPHRSGDMHLHLLARDEFENINPTALWKYLFKAFGRAKVERVDDHFSVTRYCSKYVVKPSGHYEFFGNAKAWDSRIDRGSIIDL